MKPTLFKGAFGAPDDAENIVFDQSTDASGIPQIKAATLAKLVERATHESYPGTSCCLRLKQFL